jgi:hypothetical protein
MLLNLTSSQRLPEESLIDCFSADQHRIRCALAKQAGPSAEATAPIHGTPHLHVASKAKSATTAFVAEVGRAGVLTFPCVFLRCGCE